MTEDMNENGYRKVSQEENPLQARSLRLKTAIQNAGGNAVVSRKSGVPKPSISNYMAGRDMKVSALMAIADACGVTLDWLVRGEETEQTEKRSLSITPSQSYTVDRRRSDDDTLIIPFFQTEASAGTGIVAQNWEDAEEIHVSKGFLRSIFGYVPQNVLLMRAHGDSMQPTIQSQDVLIVNYTPSNDLRPGIYIMALNDTTLVKRLDIKDPKTYEIISDNKEYNSFDVSMSEVCWGNSMPNAAVRIIGKVAGHIHLDK